MAFALNVLISATVISFASWLSGRFPALAGFVVALPLATMLVLPLSYREHASADVSVTLAKSIFFVPFLLAERLALSFWKAYAFGCLALPLGFFAHRAITRAWFG